MTVVVQFPWRTDPALIFISFVSDSNVGIDTAAVVAPLFPRSWISNRLASYLERFGCLTLGTDASAQAQILIEGLLIGSLKLERRLRPLPVRIEPGTRAELMLGLDFLSLFRECRLTFSGATATIVLEPFELTPPVT